MDNLLTTREVSDSTGIPFFEVQRLVRLGRISPAFKIGTKWRIHPAFIVIRPAGYAQKIAAGAERPCWGRPKGAKDKKRRRKSKKTKGA